jgi:hypothetical protein
MMARKMRSVRRQRLFSRRMISRMENKLAGKSR